MRIKKLCNHKKDKMYQLSRITNRIDKKIYKKKRKIVQKHEEVKIKTGFSFTSKSILFFSDSVKMRAEKRKNPNRHLGK